MKTQMIYNGSLSEINGKQVSFICKGKHGLCALVEYNNKTYLVNEENLTPAKEIA